MTLLGDLLSVAATVLRPGLSPRSQTPAGTVADRVVGYVGTPSDVVRPLFTEAVVDGFVPVVGFMDGGQELGEDVRLLRGVCGPSRVGGPWHAWPDALLWARMMRRAYPQVVAVELDLRGVSPELGVVPAPVVECDMGVFAGFRGRPMVRWLTGRGCRGRRCVSTGGLRVWWTG